MLAPINLRHKHLNKLLNLDSPLSRLPSADLKCTPPRRNRRGCRPHLITGARLEAESDCKGTGVWQMSNFGPYTWRRLPQTRAKSRGAEACHCARNNSCANYTASVSRGWFLRGAHSRLVSSRQPGTRLRDPTLRLTQHESLIVSRQPDTSATTLFLSSSSALIFHFPDNTYINLSTGSYKASVRPWLYCLSH